MPWTVPRDESNLHTADAANHNLAGGLAKGRVKVQFPGMESRQGGKETGSGVLLVAVIAGEVMQGEGSSYLRIFSSFILYTPLPPMMPIRGMAACALLAFSA